MTRRDAPTSSVTWYNFLRHPHPDSANVMIHFSERIMVILWSIDCWVLLKISVAQLKSFNMAKTLSNGRSVRFSDEWYLQVLVLTVFLMLNCGSPFDYTRIPNVKPWRKPLGDPKISHSIQPLNLRNTEYFLPDFLNYHPDMLAHLRYAIINSLVGYLTNVQFFRFYPTTTTQLVG